MEIFSLVQYMSALLLAQRIMAVHHHVCVLLEFDDLRDGVFSVYENHYTNLTFWLNTSACEQPDMVYRIEVHTKTDVGDLEFDGRVVMTYNICSVTVQKSVSCSSPTGPAQIYRKMNRSHIEIEWTLSWKNADHQNFAVIQKGVKLNVFYPSEVTNLTVDGTDVAGKYLIEEGHKVNISCFFDRGNPPAVVRLRDRIGQEVKLAENEEYIHHSFRAQCKDSWPFFACEGTGSKENRNVSFLVRCAPQFVDISPKIIDHAAYESWIFSIRAHTTAFKECILAKVSYGESFHRKINCVLSGNPPDLLLIVHVDKEDNSRMGNWTLSLRNEKGISSIGFALVTVSH